MNYNRVVCFDLEMCCWEGKTGEIIEIGLAEIDLPTTSIVKRSQFYVKPDHDEISEYCVELTGITQRIVNRQGRPLADVLKSVEKAYGSTNKIFAAWGHDEEVLFKECDKKGIDRPFREFLNLSTLYRIHYRMNKRMGMMKALKQQNMEFEGRQHSGADDAYNLARLALKFL
jgi:inhibitor of KinA sporulation pathway (predicted exonuclease)